MFVPPRNKREYLRDLVLAKNKAFRPLTDEEKLLGFLGWHERGYLPHCDYPGLVQLVTVRLADSLPASRRTEWEHLLSIEDNQEKRIKLEAYLDRGLGECLRREARAAAMVEAALLHGHDVTHEALAWCVMPNQAHVLVHVWRTPMAKLLQSWKSFTAGAINGSLGRSGQIWEPEYWDTFMRDEEQEMKAIRYIENNPPKAKLCATAEHWQFGSARFRDVYRRLVLPQGVGAQSSGSARS